MRNYPRINIGVGGLILRGGSEVLLVKRKSDSLTWTIPSGYVKKKENLFETISREVKEENNIIIKPKGIIGIRQRFTKREGNNFWIIVIADYKSGKAIPDNSEILETQFMKPAKFLKEKITPVTKQVIRLLLNKKLKKLLPQKNLNKKKYRFFA